MGKRSQEVQSERRLASLDRHAFEESEIENLPRNQGDALGCLQWTDYRTGKVRKWIVRIGDRRDRITVESPGEKPSASHGWTWLTTKLRKHLA